MNLRHLHLTTILGLILLCAISVNAQSWNIVPITVAQGTFTALDTFGVALTGTYCNDPALGETGLPPNPPAGVFDARFVDHRDPACLDQGQRLHVQVCNTSEADTFQLAFQKGDGAYSFVFTWSAGLASAWTSLVLQDALTGTFVNVDMLTNTTTTITLTFVSAVNIIGVPLVCESSVERDNDLLPGQFSLNQNYPNPFNPSTTIKFAMEKSAFADVAVYDILGRKIATLASEELTPGFYTTTWNGTDDRGVPAASGVYYVRMTATNGRDISFSDVRKLLLMK